MLLGRGSIRVEVFQGGIEVENGIFKYSRVGSIPLDY